MDPYSAILSYSMKDNFLTKVHPKKRITNKNSDKNDDFIMVVGFDRTGIRSIQTALHKLGYRCYSFNDAYNNNKHKDIWINLLQLKYNKFVEIKSISSSSPSYNDWNIKTMVKYNGWDQLFSGYNGCCGSPSNAFFLEIKSHFHGKFKIILSIRDNGEAWYKSIMMTWYKYLKILSKPLFKISIKYNKNYKFIKYIYLVLFKIDINEYKEKSDYLKAKYGEWKKFVKDSVYPPNKLLIYNCRQGWEPLCTFLGKEKPPKSVKFPHKSKQSDFAKLLKSAEHAQKVALNFIIMVGIVCACIIRYVYFEK